MRLSERVFVFLVIVYSAILCDNNKSTKQKGRHLLSLLGYIHGYKIGQDYALQVPPYFVAPVFIVPSYSQQQSVNIQTGSTDDNYQENGGNVQSTGPSKIILPNNNNKTNEVEILDVVKANDDSQRKPVEAANTKMEEVMFRQGMVSNNASDVLNTTKIDGVSTENSTMNATTIEELKPTSIGPYPAANYNNENVNELTLTTAIPVTDISQSLPPVSDNRWQNFTLKGNLNVKSDDNSEMSDEKGNNVSSITSPSKENVMENPRETATYYRYPNAWYNNGAIDQLSITTNHYTNEPSSSKNDRWAYSPENTIMLPSGFRPLAGLYYDGFLHRPLKKFGFIP